MVESGIFQSDFSLGDLLGLDDATEGRQPGSEGGGEQPTRKKLPEFPETDGSETLQEYVGQYKKPIRQWESFEVLRLPITYIRFYI